MPPFARQRDANEPEIVEALEAVGATVCKLNAKGQPDLLVGYNLETFLLEVKLETKTGKVKRQGRATDERGLLETQQEWWSAWRGKPPVVVKNAAEALDAIGHPRCPRCGVDVIDGEVHIRADWKETSRHLRLGTLPRPVGKPDIPALVCDRCNWIQEVGPARGTRSHG